jgi:hypothetical protein
MGTLRLTAEHYLPDDSQMMLVNALCRAWGQADNGEHSYGVARRERRHAYVRKQ